MQVPDQIPEKRLYLITPSRIVDPDAFARILDDALSPGGVVAIQLRLKADNGAAAPATDIRRAASALIPVCRARGVAFILNDDPRLARETGADGVHVGQSDAPYREARAILGEDATVGVTCHASKHLAMEAGEAGADYVAFGAFFATSTKDAQTRAPIDLIADWATATTVPCVAIGGITPENCGPLIEAGADFLAASAAVWAGPDGPRAAVEAFNQAFVRHG
ncbi:MAG: thiamine phosphate synthase [Alphaproteobacteria bacterium]|nr:thiamine phosphate synthase [Alphaproteobacteria bacterium]